MIASNSLTPKVGKQRWEVKGTMKEFEGRRRGMIQPSQQHVAPCVEGIEWGLGTRGLRIVAAFWAGIHVEFTKEAGVVARCRRAAIRTSF